jgi:hypothetical protein
MLMSRTVMRRRYTEARAAARAIVLVCCNAAPERQRVYIRAFGALAFVFFDPSAACG